MPFTPVRHETAEPQRISDHNAVYVQGLSWTQRGCHRCSAHTASQRQPGFSDQSHSRRTAPGTWPPLALASSASKPRACLAGEQPKSWAAPVRPAGARSQSLQTSLVTHLSLSSSSDPPNQEAEGTGGTGSLPHLLDRRLRSGGTAGTPRCEANAPGVPWQSAYEGPLWTHHSASCWLQHPRREERKGLGGLPQAHLFHPELVSRWDSTKVSEGLWISVFTPNRGLGDTLPPKLLASFLGKASTRADRWLK